MYACFVMLYVMWCSCFDTFMFRMLSLCAATLSNIHVLQRLCCVDLRYVATPSKLLSSNKATAAQGEWRDPVSGLIHPQMSCVVLLCEGILLIPVRIRLRSTALRDSVNQIWRKSSRFYAHRVNNWMISRNVYAPPIRPSCGGQTRHHAIHSLLKQCVLMT
jgi:hypothetical protein